MTENPLTEALSRLTGMARLYGIAYCKVTWDADSEVYNFSTILPEYVIVTYEEKKHD